MAQSLASEDECRACEGSKSSFVGSTFILRRLKPRPFWLKFEPRRMSVGLRRPNVEPRRASVPASEARRSASEAGTFVSYGLLSGVVFGVALRDLRAKRWLSASRALSRAAPLPATRAYW